MWPAKSSELSLLRVQQPHAPMCDHASDEWSSAMYDVLVCKQTADKSKHMLAVHETHKCPTGVSRQELALGRLISSPAGNKTKQLEPPQLQAMNTCSHFSKHSTCKLFCNAQMPNGGEPPGTCSGPSGFVTSRQQKPDNLSHHCCKL